MSLPCASSPVISKTMRFCSVTTSPSMPTTSVMCVILREPSRRREAWMMTSIEPVIISRMVLGGSAIAAHHDHRFETAEGLARAVGVQRAHRAVVARVHGLQQVERLRSAHLADDDALGPHAQAVLDEIAHGDLAFAFEVGRARLETHDVRLLQLQLGGVLAGDDALVVVDRAGQAIEQRRLARAGAAGDQHVAAHPADDLEHGLGLRRDRART